MFGKCEVRVREFAYRPATDESYWTSLVRPIVAGRRIILTGGPVAGFTARAQSLVALGAEKVFVLGSEGVGTGELPEGEWFALSPTADNDVDLIRAGNKLVASLPADAVAAIDRFDPDGSAMVIGSFLHEAPAVAGRPSLAYRRPEWLALEDKLVADALWDRCGVARAPSVCVPVAGAAAAARDVDSDHGTVWAGDNREGFHGAGEKTRWVRTASDADEAAAFFAVHCDRVRVMPFLDGIPCSIHGLVFPDTVVALRPIEMIVLRRPTSSEFFYTGAASFWDPPPSDREDMRALARRVGAVLRAEVGFRGPFTVDGVLTASGFLPTELNPRSGAGQQTLLGGLPDLPISLLHDAIVAGLDLDYRPDDLESLIVSSADASRAGGTWRALPVTIPPRTAEEVPGGRVTVGTSLLGSFVRFMPHRESTPVGPSFAPVAVSFWSWADASLGTGLGPLAAAVAVR